MTTSVRLEDALVGGRVFRKLVRGTPRARDELAATVRTSAGQHAFRAGAAEGALERADARVGRVWRQVAVAALTGRTQLQHQRCTGSSDDRRFARREGRGRVRVATSTGAWHRHAS